MKDNKIHIPARKKKATENNTVIKVSPEAYSTLVDIYNESTLSLKEIASILIIEASKNVVYDKEG